MASHQNGDSSEAKKKYVDNLGIMEIRISCDDPEVNEPPIDMYEWQQTTSQSDLGFP